MAARRCPLCAISYPLGYMTCQVCGDTLDWLATADIDADWQQRVSRALDYHPVTENARVAAWRLYQLLRMGFDVGAAESLAASDVDVRFIEERLLRRGCTLELAARIA